MGITKPCTHLHPPPSIYTQLISTSTHLHLAHFSLHPALCNTHWLQIGTQSISMILILIPTLLFSVSNPKSIFGKIWAKKFKVAHFD